MKKIFNKNICLLILFVFIFSACSDDDPFAGTDNYISSFSLKQAETVLEATIQNNTIILQAPEGASLNGAVATVVLSENAQILPNPAEITNWDEEIIFVVTAHNGTRVQYKYKVDRTSIEHEGSIVLATQADIETFGKQGVTYIKGNLILGQSSGADSITSLAPLASLKEIGYSLVAYPTVALVNFEGLDNLEKVGDLIQIEQATKVESVSFPALKTVGGVSLQNEKLLSIKFPKLVQVSKSFKINAPMGEVSLGSLERIGDLLQLRSNYSTKPILSSVVLPSLKEAKTIEISFLESVKKVDFSDLERVSDVILYPLKGLIFINAPKLHTVEGQFATSAVSSLSEFSLPELVEAKNLIIEGQSIRTVSLPKLKTVTGKLSLLYAKVNGIANGFESLQNIEGELYLGDLTMTSLVFPASLNRIQKLTLYNRSTTPLSVVNVKGLNIGELALMAEAVNNVKIVGDEVFKGILSILPDNAKTYDLKFPKLEGFTEVDSLNLGTYISVIDTLDIKGIKKINRSLWIPNNNLKGFSISDLEEVGGNFTISHLNSITAETTTQVNINDLKKVGGDFDISVNSRSVRTLNVPKLQIVGGNFTIGTGYLSTSSWSPSCDLKTLLFNQLATIGGKLTLVSDKNNNSSINQELVDLNGFSSLKNVQSIEIKNQAALVSFSGLKNALSSFGTTQWSVSNNAYNPTYDQLKAGQWVRP